MKAKTEEEKKKIIQKRESVKLKNITPQQQKDMADFMKKYGE